MKLTLNFLPAFAWKYPNAYPFYQPFVYYSKNAKKIVFYWGLGFFYFRQMFKKSPDGNLGRFRWFFHLKINILSILFFPFILWNNKRNFGYTGLIKS